jgi:hypothetical protein
MNVPQRNDIKQSVTDNDDATNSASEAFDFWGRAKSRAPDGIKWTEWEQNYPEEKQLLEEISPEIDFVVFKRKRYKTRLVFVPSFGVECISVQSLNEKLIGDNGQLISDEACFIDEQIFFFVEDEEIDLPNLELAKLIHQSILQ